MANSDKNIVITPNTGQAATPTIVFTGGSATPGTLTVDDAGTLSFDKQFISSVATGTAPFAVSSTTRVSNLNVATAGTADNAVTFDSASSLTRTASHRANRNITGGGTISVDGSANVKWTGRFIVMSNGRGSYFSTNGYFDIDCPTTGTITGVGGASSVTVTAAGIPLSAWQALYYIMPIGSNNVSVAANFRIASYTADADIPHQWLLICVRNGDSGVCYFNNGIALKNSESIDVATHDARRSTIADAWTTARTLTIGSTGKSIDGTGNVSWSLNEIGALPLSGGSMTGLLAGRPSIGTNVNIMNDSGSFSIRSDSANAASVSFHRTDAYAINMGLGTDNVFRIGGWFASANAFQMTGGGALTMLGDVTAFSDIRLKDNIKTIPNALTKILNSRGVTFTRTDQEDQERVHIGVIAQEIEKYFPEVVLEDTSGIKSVNYGAMAGAFIEAIKEQQTIIESQNQRLSNLERLVNNTGSRN